MSKGRLKIGFQTAFYMRCYRKKWLFKASWFKSECKTKTPSEISDGVFCQIGL